MEILGQIVREERIKLGKSQRLLADEYDVEKSLINRTEKATSELKLISLFTIAHLLKTTPSILLGKVEKKLPDNFTLFDE